MDETRTNARLTAIAGLIGGTPLLAIDLRWKKRLHRVYAKAEFLNLTGSIKDRMAFRILSSALRSGALHPGDTIVEATSGNTGIALSAVGRAMGCSVRIFMPDWMSQERQALISSFGAQLSLVSRADGGFLGAIAQTEACARESERIFLPRQFDNPMNVLAHEEGTGVEILRQLDRAGVKPAGFIAGVGTGGTVMGVGRALRKAQSDIRIHPLEPAESPTLSTGHKIGSHRIQGISDDFIPAIVKLDELDHPVAVADGDGILMAQRLARELGLGVGISSGANLIGALRVQEELGADAPVATIFCDDNKKYLSTDLARNEPVREGYCTPEVELIGYSVLPAIRV
jgi:cysteine synthase A